MWLGKTIQRRILHLLSDRTTFLAVLAGLLLLVVSFLSFGEAWLQWSADKYSAIFNSFSDNVAGRSLQSRLCQYVPIDVVYTWVNGSDPLFQDGLKHAKERLRNDPDRKLRLLKSCPFENCAPSHFLTTDSLLPQNTQLEYLRAQNAFLSQDLVDFKDQNLVCMRGRHDEEHDEYGKVNRTFLIMENVDASLAVSKANITEIGVGTNTYPISQAHWTTEWTVPNSFPIPDHIILTKLPPAATKDKIIGALPTTLSEKIGRVWMFHDNNMAVFQVLDPDLVAEFLRDNDVIHMENGANIVVWPAYLIVALPKFADDGAVSTNRFADTEELRYSLRSLEKYAPWVRHIYLVTNGQIPHWINLDHSRLTIITHEEIFENKSHLPTFSSPAIEANLHRIPGLSAKYLYMNDDIFFGQEVWPNDFYDESVGQKVYFSWPLPDCAPGCPNSWINDGYCDLVCNTTNCMHDGGDCFGDNPAMGFGGDNSVAFHWDYTGDYTLACADGCLDPWLADGFCDDSCNVAECGYDVGDCGYSRYAYLFQGPKINISRETINITEWTFSLPPGTTVAFWDLSDLFATASEMGLVPTEHHDVRAVGLSDQHHFLTVVLHSNISEAYLNVTLQGRSRDGANALIFRLGIRCNTSNHHPKLEEPFEEDIAVAYERLPDAVENARSGDFEIDLSEVDVLKLNLSREALQSLQMIDDQLADDEITAKGFKVKRTALLQPFVRRFVVNGGKLSDLEEDDNEFEAHQIRLGGDLNTNAGNRKLMDAYGDSLLHVHKLYTKKYGYVDRMGISHMPHLIDKAIFVEMKGKYEKEWEVTSGNVMRKSNDMQFAFSYFHYLANEKEVFDIHRVFREYDTDATGTWSDREIRTLLTRIHSLPLDLEQINSFEKTIIDCATNMSNMGIELPSPKTMSQLYERYYDSKLPLVSEFLIVYCEPLVAFLRFSLKDAKKYKHTIIDDAEKSIAFRTISSNISQVVSVLDNLRKEPRKFLCLNDDTDPNEETGNKMVHAVLVDYLESVLPVPSSFELPQHYKNKFLYTFELSRWQLYRSILTVTTYLSVMLLIVIVIAGYFKVDIDAKVAAFGRFLVTSWLYVNRRRYDQNHIGVVQEPQGYSV